MKKVLLYVLTGTMIMSMFTGCSKDTSKDMTKMNSVNVEEEYEEIIENIGQSVNDNFNSDSDEESGEKIQLDIDGKVGVKLVSEDDEDDSASIKAEVGADVDADIQPDDISFSGSANLSYDIDAAGEKESDGVEMKMYGATEDDVVTVYSGSKNSDDDEFDWEKSTSDLEDVKEGLEELMEDYSSDDSIDFSEISDEDMEILKKYVKLSDTTVSVNNKECYEFTLTIDADMIDTLVEDYGDMIEEETGVDFEDYVDIIDQLDTFKIVISAYVDKDTYKATRVSVEGDVEGNFMGVDISVSTCYLTIDVVTGDADVEKVPADVAKEAGDDDADDADDYDFDYDLDDEDDMDLDDEDEDSDSDDMDDADEDADKDEDEDADKAADDDADADKDEDADEDADAKEDAE